MTLDPLLHCLEQERPPVGLMARVEDEIADIEAHSAGIDRTGGTLPVLHRHWKPLILGILLGAFLATALFLAGLHPLLDAQPFLPA